MSEISQLSPNKLWQWFDQICAIPHPSYHEKQLADFILHWAKEKGLFTEQDEAGNILIRKPATKGMENRKKVALQAHLDMVPQANAETKHDFTRDAIQPYIDGNWVKAKGTTLGADNGIGLASCLAVLESEDLSHPDLEVLLTMTEEAGMEGVLGLRPNWLQSEILINTDTEDNGEIYIGCAGGEDANLELPIAHQANLFENTLQIQIKGLNGGHSGCDIHTGRVNAIKLLARLLADLQSETEFALVELSGGTVRNAIPREAQAVIAYRAKNEEKLTACIQAFEAQAKKDFNLAEPNLLIEYHEAEKPSHVFTQESTQNTIHALNLLPNGVIRYSDVVEGVVETSLSVGILETKSEIVRANLLIRSLIESGKSEVKSRLDSLASLCKAKTRYAGNYPGWQPDPNSQITPLTKRIYDEVLGYESVIKVIHAGLECGLIKEKHPNLDVVSIGPTIRNAHSPDEKVHIPAVEIYWQLLTKLLADIPAK